VVLALHQPTTEAKLKYKAGDKNKNSTAFRRAPFAAGRITNVEVYNVQPRF